MDHIDIVEQLKKKLEKGCSFEKTMHILYKLQKIPISIQILEKTGIGLTVRNLSKEQKDNDIGQTARVLAYQWKDIVRTQRDKPENKSEEPAAHSSSSTSLEKCQEISNSHIKSHKKHKSKKSKKKNHRDEDSDHEDEIDSGSYNKKKLKKRHRDACDSDEEEQVQSNIKHSKHTNHVVTDQSCDKPNSQVSSPVTNSSHHKSKNIVSHKIMPADDIFGSILNSNDKLQPSSSNFRKSLAHPPASSTSTIENEILKQLPDPNYRPPKLSFNAGYRPNKPNPVASSQFSSALTGHKLKGRTAVFAGSSKANYESKLYSLQELCIKFLMNHVDQICEVGNLPYYVLKPVLKKCKVNQLERIEKYNPSLAEDTDELWEAHVDANFKNSQKPDSMTWKEFYKHLVNVRETKLLKVTEGISKRKEAAVKERTVKTVDLLPTSMRRRQAQPTHWKQPSLNRNGSDLGTSGSKTSFAGQTKTTAPLMKKLNKMRNSKFRR